MYCRYMLNNFSPSTVISFALFLLGLTTAFILGGSVDYWHLDKERWKLIVPIAMPLAGIVLGAVGVSKVKHYYKLLPVLLIFLNLALTAVILLAYGFSYWEF